MVTRRRFLALTAIAAGSGAAVVRSVQVSRHSPPPMARVTPARAHPVASPAKASPAAQATALPFRLVWEADFTTDVPLGRFPADAAGWEAYEYGWPDTATQRGLAVGGIYDPATTTWVSRGQLHVRQWRGPSGPVHCSVPYPLATNGVRYGRFIEVSRVSKTAVGYKSAHMLYGKQEVDWPETNWGGWGSIPAAFFHYDKAAPKVHQLSFRAKVNPQQWHTYEIRWQPGRLAAYVDGWLVGETTDPQVVPSVKLHWRLQNESALIGGFAAPGTSAQIDTKVVQYWAWEG